MNNTLLLAIIGHLVGDYLLQTDWMALNKKKNLHVVIVGCSDKSCPAFCISKFINGPCFVHCLLWTISVCLFTGWCAWPVVTILFVTHYIQDRTHIILWWMKLKWKDQSQFAQPPMAPWSMIVVDNVWHIVTLWAVWRFIA